MIVWIEVSLQKCLKKKKKFKLLISSPEEDYEAVFQKLLEDIKTKLLKPSIISSVEELPEFSLVYKSEGDFEDDGTELGDGDDLEGMFDDYPDGKKVRVIVLIDEGEF